MPKTKFFRVATSGATTDGRTIDPQVLHEMAATYDPKTYQARVNLEHIQSAHPGSAFGAYGDVLGLKTEPVTLNIGGRTEQRTGLYAQIDALEPLVDLQARSQKLFTSIQVRPNFAGSGKAYLDGLAFTDNPASLGTEMMKFCAGAGEASPLHFRKTSADTIIAAAEEVKLEFMDETVPAVIDDADSNGFMAALRRCFEGFAAKPVAELTPAPVAAAPAANSFADPSVIAAFAALRSVMEDAATRVDAGARAQAETTAALAALRAEFATLKTESAELKAALEKLPAASFTARLRATGATSEADQALKADC